VKLPWQISAGEFFDLLRPAALIASALLSTWVLASARRWKFSFAAVGAWAIGTFLFPFIVLPVYLLVRASRKRSATPETSSPETSDQKEAAAKTSPAKFRFLPPTAYGLVLLSLTGISLYRDYHSLDAHLARATQARVMNQRARTIREYRAALQLEDDPHTHKLLGIELAESRDWPAALSEFRAAERGGEPDDSLPFRIALALEATGQLDEANSEFTTFLNSRACTESPPDSRCATARERLLSRSNTR
jgi:hypothetical protein